MKIELEIEIPEGYEATGEYRFPKEDEWFLGGNGKPMRAPYNFEMAMHIILRKKAEPRYRSFEINWHTGPVPLIDGYIAMVGMILERYRIFGFGDDEEYDPAHTPASYRPCTCLGKYKYAYGCLEVDNGEDN